jgi:hypothetical protein
MKLGPYNVDAGPSDLVPSVRPTFIAGLYTCAAAAPSKKKHNVYRTQSSLSTHKLESKFQSKPYLFSLRVVFYLIALSLNLTPIYT